MTLRQEIEELIEYYRESPIYYGVIVANRLTDILSRHPEEPTAPSQRERIAIELMKEYIRNSTNPEWTHAQFAEPAVTAADALMKELLKPALERAQQHDTRKRKNT